MQRQNITKDHTSSLLQHTQTTMSYTAAEEQRKRLEQLMGKEALIYTSVRRKDPEMTSHRVCKAFLVGSCPYDMFTGTKQDLGKCPQLHLEKHKLEYEYRTKQLGESFPEFEREYYMVLSKFINELDKTLEVAQKRLEHTPEEKEKIIQVTKELDQLDTLIGLITKELEYLMNVNEPLKTLKEAQKLEQVLKQREKVAETARGIVENIGQTSQQKLQVCEGCGAYLSRLDSDRRLADHFVGKIHLAYVSMRQTYDELNHKYKRMGV